MAPKIRFIGIKCVFYEKKSDRKGLTKQVIPVCIHTAVVKVPEVLEKDKKGYHFEAKLLPKRILTLGASQHASTKFTRVPFDSYGYMKSSC